MDDLLLINKLDPYDPDVQHVTTFLRLLLEDGAAYSTINVARCALSAVLETGNSLTIGNDWLWEPKTSGAQL